MFRAEPYSPSAMLSFVSSISFQRNLTPCSFVSPLTKPHPAVLVIPSRAVVSHPGTHTLSMMASADPFKLPARVVADPLPRLYIYDHCPFCVRCRYALGLKNIKHELVFLANDDAKTPTALVGKKQVPILELGRPGSPDYEVIKESLDIIKRVDSDPKFGPVNMFKPASGRADLNEWMDVSSKDAMTRLIRPRYMKSHILPEFAFQDGRDAYLKNHQIKGEPSDYEQNFKMSAELIPRMNKLLEDLDTMIYCEHYCTESAGGVSMDDILILSRLRSVLLVKGLAWPAKLKKYLDRMQNLSEIPSYEGIAI